MVYKQTPKVLIVRGVTLWWWLGIITLGILILWDIMKFKRSRLIIGEKSVTVEVGVLSQNSREIPFSKIQSVTVNQSVLGQMLSYGHINITSGNELAPITFRYLDNPQIVKQAIQDRIQ